MFIRKELKKSGERITIFICSVGGEELVGDCPTARARGDKCGVL